MSNRKEVFTIVTREKGQYWTRVGVAFTNKDGSLNVTLEALPLNGKLHIREPKTQDAPASTQA